MGMISSFETHDLDMEITKIKRKIQSLKKDAKEENQKLMQDYSNVIFDKITNGEGRKYKCPTFGCNCYVHKDCYNPNSTNCFCHYDTLIEGVCQFILNNDTRKKKIRDLGLNSDLINAFKKEFEKKYAAFRHSIPNHRDGWENAMVECLKGCEEVFHMQDVINQNLKLDIEEQEVK